MGNLLIVEEEEEEIDQSFPWPSAVACSRRCGNAQRARVIVESFA
jgi:hypothetical protein